MHTKSIIPPTSLISAAILTGCVVFGFWLGRQYPAGRPIEVWSLLLVGSAIGLVLLLHEVTRVRIEHITLWVRLMKAWQRLSYRGRTRAAAFAFTARTLWAWVQVALIAALGFFHLLWKGKFVNYPELVKAYEEWLKVTTEHFDRRVEEAACKWLVHGAGRKLACQLLRQTACNVQKVGYHDHAARFNRMADQIRDG